MTEIDQSNISIENIVKEAEGEDYLSKLEEEGYRIIDVIAGDVSITPEMKYIIDKISQHKRNTFYSDILYTMTSERFTEIVAKQLWQEILKHKYVMSEKLGRNIGIHVTALDYLENIKGIIEMPKIIDETEFRKTLSLATIDSLTGLYNRREFMEKLRWQIEISKVENNKFCLLMLDLDGFKNFNDTEGHQAGDLILQEFAVLLKRELRKQDIIGRYGGDEIVVLFPYTDKNDARKIGEKLRETVEKEFKQINITLSIGLAEFPYEGQTSDELIYQADALMFRAKEFGKNQMFCLVGVKLTYNPQEKKLRTVSCVGDFNLWNKNSGKMSYDEKTNLWSITLNLKPGRYCYKFLIDGTEWVFDQNEKETTDDGFGGRCSLITVRC